MGKLLVASRSNTAGFIFQCNKSHISDTASHCAGYFFINQSCSCHLLV